MLVNQHYIKHIQSREQSRDRHNIQIGNRTGLFIREYKQSVARLQLIANIRQICVSHHYMFYVVISDHNYHLIAMEIVSSIQNIHLSPSLCVTTSSRQLGSLLLTWFRSLELFSALAPVGDCVDVITRILPVLFGGMEHQAIRTQRPGGFP